MNFAGQVPEWSDTEVPAVKVPGDRACPIHSLGQHQTWALTVKDGVNTISITLHK